MAVYFTCDQCGETTPPDQLRKVVALHPMHKLKNAMLMEDLHTGDVCLNCIRAIRELLPQPPKEDTDDAPQVVQVP